MAGSVRETARKLESDFARRRSAAWCEDRGSGYNFGRRWTYLQGNKIHSPPPSHSLVKFQLNCASFNTAVHSLLEDQWKLDTPMSRSLSVG